MVTQIRIGTRVKWPWGTGWGHGTVAERFTRKVTRTIKGATITRRATEKEPAYLIDLEDGDKVLKSSIEIERE